MAPLAQPHPQDTCRIGSVFFFALGWPEGRFGIDWVEMKWSPLNRLHLNPFLSSHPPKLSLALVYSSSNGQHSACRWPHIAITLCCPIVLDAIALLPSIPSLSLSSTTSMSTLSSLSLLSPLLQSTSLSLLSPSLPSLSLASLPLLTPSLSTSLLSTSGIWPN